MLSPPAEDNALDVAITAHEIAAGDEVVPCWSYVTKGLSAHGHPEVVFTVRRADGATEPPSEPMTALGSLLSHARTGRIASAGTRLSFGDKAMLFGQRWGGWMFIAAAPMRGVQVPHGALQAVLLTPEETAVTAVAGPTRIAARLGEQASFFPCPPWSEPRPSVADPDEATSSRLDGVPRVFGIGATVTRLKEPAQLVLSLPASEAESFGAELPKLPADQCLSIHTAIADDADACLVWRPGQTAARGITKAGSGGARLAGSFVVFVPEQAADQVIVQEDGFFVLLTDLTWARLREALAAGAALSLPTGDASFELTWRSPTDH